MSENPFKHIFDLFQKEVDRLHEEEQINSVISSLREAFVEACHGNARIELRPLRQRDAEVNNVASDMLRKLQRAGNAYSVTFSYKDENSVLEPCTKTFKVLYIVLTGRWPVYIIPREHKVDGTDVLTCFDTQGYIDNVASILKEDNLCGWHCARAREYVQFKAEQKASQA